METFIAAFEKPPEEIVPDIDAVHGCQEGASSCRSMSSAAITCWWPGCDRAGDSVTPARKPWQNRHPGQTARNSRKITDQNDLGRVEGRCALP